MIGTIKSLLAHPVTKNLSIDDPKTTEYRRDIVRNNTFLWKIYDEWYRLLCTRIPEGPGRVLEIGSGGGFFASYVQDLIASEVFPCPDIQLVLDARCLPFPAGSLRSIALVDVLHHIPDNRQFFEEAQRCLRPGGSIVMIEPWVSRWSRLIYTKLHHEPFDCSVSDWAFPAEGPLSSANGALPWIIFSRDRQKFESQFPNLKIEIIKPLMPFRYLVSGGVSMRQLMPGPTFGMWKKLETAFFGNQDKWPMFAFICIKRI